MFHAKHRAPRPSPRQCSTHGMVALVRAEPPQPPINLLNRWAGSPPPVLKGMGRVIAIASQKGGVGKTTTAINLGACIAQEGHRVLIIDIDPQGNASSGLGINGNDRLITTYEVLIGQHEMPAAICPTALANLDLMAAGQSLSGAEVELVGMMARETRLKSALGPVRDEYEFILVDSPPSLGLLTINALTAS